MKVLQHAPPDPILNSSEQRVIEHNARVTLCRYLHLSQKMPVRGGAACLPETCGAACNSKSKEAKARVSFRRWLSQQRQNGGF